jgi:hypothetical protein
MEGGTLKAMFPKSIFASSSSIFAMGVALG